MPTGIYKRKPFSEEHKRKISEHSVKFWLGKKLSLETKQKMSERQRGKGIQK